MDDFDLRKHLTARRSSRLPAGDAIDVLYGIYYIEYYLIAGDTFATYSLFFDFIANEVYAEKITEQYYKDVVAIMITKESRRISLSVNDLPAVSVDDIPVFTLSLAGGEKRSLTFLNAAYFSAIKKEINLDENEIPKIFWIQDSEKTFVNGVKVLRHTLRLHKGTEND